MGLQRPVQRRPAPPLPPPQTALATLPLIMRSPPGPSAPAADVINFELALADVSQIERRLDRLKKTKGGRAGPGAWRGCLNSHSTPLSHPLVELVCHLDSLNAACRQAGASLAHAPTVPTTAPRPPGPCRQVWRGGQEERGGGGRAAAHHGGTGAGQAGAGGGAERGGGRAGWVTRGAVPPRAAAYRPQARPLRPSVPCGAGRGAGAWRVALWPRPCKAAGAGHDPRVRAAPRDVRGRDAHPPTHSHAHALAHPAPCSPLARSARAVPAHRQAHGVRRQRGRGRPGGPGRQHARAGGFPPLLCFHAAALPCRGGGEPWLRRSVAARQPCSDRCTCTSARWPAQRSASLPHARPVWIGRRSRLLAACFSCAQRSHRLWAHKLCNLDPSPPDAPQALKKKAAEEGSGVVVVSAQVLGHVQCAFCAFCRPPALVCGRPVAVLCSRDVRSERGGAVRHC